MVSIAKSFTTARFLSFSINTICFVDTKVQKIVVRVVKELRNTIIWGEKVKNKKVKRVKGDRHHILLR
jgi:hypothetical protein